ncbi:hypothetical protein RB653_008372 [Dictyostelium firmibasis]|uniref:Uncharacterized protein n=1 Tax=Dictyostelium firmibasis TaxID=79012 RepID=A0AAN7TSN8_9MYCE
MKNLIKFLLVFLSFLYITEASHFRFGSISWIPVPNYKTIKFTANLAFRTTFFRSSVSIGDKINVGSISFGDGTSDTVTLSVTSFDTTNDWFTGSWVSTHEYPGQINAEVRNYVATYTSCCRISSLLNNADDSWYIATNVQIDSSNSYADVNWSPVTNMMPIVRVAVNKNNNFRILANDQNKATALTYKFTDTYTMSQPPGMTVNPSNGECYFMPTTLGLYSTQVKITDAKGAWIVVDFLLEAYTETGKCEAYCSNPEASCTSNSQCIKCANAGSTVINTCSNIDTPPIFIAPTPNNGEVRTFPIDVSSSFSLSCKTQYTSRTVSILTPNFPLEISKGAMTTGQTNTIPYSWAPKTSSIGSYVISAQCVDSKGVVSQVLSFTIRIEKPECGNGGTKQGSVCSCVGNWDPSSQCFDCKKGYYGDKCTILPPCKNGVPNQGVNGDGKCLCNNGWIGADCSISNSQSCGSMASTNLSSTFSVSSYINPTKVQVYLANNQAYQVPIMVSIPSPLSKLDVYFLVDTNMATTDTFGYIRGGMSTFVTIVKKLSENTQFGLGIFSDYPSSPISFQQSSIIGTDIVSGITDLKTSSNVASSCGNSLLAATLASSATVGWNSGSFKVIVIITDSDYTANSINDFKNSFTDRSIAPVVIGFGTATPNWASLVSSLGFGYNAQSALNAGDWPTKAVAGIKAVTSKLVYRSSQIANGASFVSGLPTDEAIAASTQKTVNGITLIKSANTNIDSPIASISVMGFGKTEISINYNRPPVATSIGISVDQNSFTTFKLVGTDPDSNILTFKFTSNIISSAGIITTSAGVDVSTQPNVYYSSSEVFKYTPKTNFITASLITFIANDGCVDSASSGTISITINKVNQAPDCQSTQISAQLNRVIEFSLNATDFEDIQSKIAIFITNPSTLTSYGSLTYKGVPVTTTTKIVNLDYLAFIQTVNPPTAISVTTPFQAMDTSSVYSKTCFITVNYVHTNEAPVSSSLSPISVAPRNYTAVTLTSTDYDSTKATFKVTSYTTGTDGKGTFFTCPIGGDCSCTSINYYVIPLNYQSAPVSYSTSDNKANFDICFANDQSSQINSYASVTFTSIDNQGLESLPVTVKINVVGTRVNDPPVVIQIADYSVFQDYKDYNTISKIVDGTDKNPDDYDKDKGINNLIAVIVKQPKSGTLYLKKDDTIVSNSPAPMEIYYVPSTGFAGTDSFSYKVSDTLQVDSTIATTTITVIPINHKPTVSVTSYSFTSQDVNNINQSLVTYDFDGDKVNCQVVAIPNQISMYDSEGKLISQVPTKLSSNSYSFKLEDPSKITPKPFSIIASQFTINCVDVTTKTNPYGSLQSDDVIANVQYTYINTAPTAHNLIVQLDQDSSKPFTFIGNDIETDPSGLKVKVFSLPINGKLSTQGGSTITSESLTQIYKLDELIYTPNSGLSNWNTADNSSPLDTISFAIVDPQGLVSDSDFVYFNVRPRNPPIYTGDDEIDVLQNTRYPLTIVGKIGNGGSSVSISVVSFTGNGSLYESFNMGAEGTMDKQITSYPVGQPYSGSNGGPASYYYAYKPPHNKYGPKFDVISFKLIDGDLESMIYNVTVNVIHVNQPPTISLISYRSLEGSTGEIMFNLSSTVEMNVNTSVLIKYIGEDIDVDQITPLISNVTTLPLKGVIYQYDHKNKASPIGNVVDRNHSNIPIDDDGFYYFIFVPNKGNIALSYARIPLSVIDNGGLTSSSVIVTINVNSVNIPPNITIPDIYRHYSGQLNLTVTATNITFDDPDSKTNDVLVTLSIVGEKDEIVQSVSNVKLNITGVKPKVCQFDRNLATVTCIGSKKDLNDIISKVNIIGQLAGKYRLKVFVDDLGFNAPFSKRISSHLNATDYVTLDIVEPDVTTQTTSNKTVLSGAIAGAGAAAAIIAAGMWKLLRKAAPPTDTFFDEGAFMGDGINSNPMYQESKNGGENPLYTSSNEPL